MQVISVNDHDDQEVVVDRPDQVEARPSGTGCHHQNGLLLIWELKSSIDKTGMYIFERIYAWKWRLARGLTPPGMVAPGTCSNLPNS